MKRFALPPLLCIVFMAGGYVAASRAADQSLQAILSTQRCVPTKVKATDLSSIVISYEVTCKGSGKLLYIVCIETDCKLQPSRREDTIGALGYRA